MRYFYYLLLLVNFNSICGQVPAAEEDYPDEEILINPPREEEHPGEFYMKYFDMTHVCGVGLWYGWGEYLRLFSFLSDDFPNFEISAYNFLSQNTAENSTESVQAKRDRGLVADQLIRRGSANLAASYERESSLRATIGNFSEHTSKVVVPMGEKNGLHGKAEMPDESDKLVRETVIEWRKNIKTKITCRKVGYKSENLTQFRIRSFSSPDDNYIWAKFSFKADKFFVTGICDFIRDGKEYLSSSVTITLTDFSFSGLYNLTEPKPRHRHSTPRPILQSFHNTDVFFNAINVSVTPGAEDKSGHVRYFKFLEKSFKWWDLFIKMFFTSVGRVFENEAINPSLYSWYRKNLSEITKKLRVVAEVTNA